MKSFPIDDAVFQYGIDALAPAPSAIATPVEIDGRYVAYTLEYPKVLMLPAAASRAAPSAIVLNERIDLSNDIIIFSRVRNWTNMHGKS